MNDDCTCPRVMIEDPPCPVHGYPKCQECGRDEHDYVSCETVRQIEERHAAAGAQGATEKT